MSKQNDYSSILRMARAKLDLTQEQLAERLGVSFATVNRWEGGTKPQKGAKEAIEAFLKEADIDVEAIKSKAPSTKSMEQMLWDAACSIRGEKEATKFKDYLLPMVFLKRLSDVFDDEITRLAEDYGDRQTALEIAENDPKLVRFYMPPEARWGVISGRDTYEWPLDEKGQSTRPKDIGEHLTKAVRAVVKYNPSTSGSPSLSGVLDVVDFAAERNGERDINPAKLRGVVEIFSDPRYRLGLADVEPDFLGRAYEYLLRKFAEGSGQSAGEFFTPTEVGFLMAHIMRPKPGEECHDYACGSAGLLIKLQLVSKEIDPLNKVPLKLTGQELQAESYAVANMNGIIHDMDIEIARGDTMINPKFRSGDGKLRTFDVVVANPMWNQPFNPDIFANDPFDRFRTTGGITSGKGDWAWLQHTLACLNDHGRAAVVLDTGAVTRGSGSKNEDKERTVRKWFVDRDLIDGVILLPDNLFYNTTAAGIIVVLNRRKPAARKNKIVLFNASKRVKKGKPKNYIPEEMIKQIAAAYLKGEAIDGEITVIDRKQAEDADYNLSPSKWVGQADDISHRPIKDIVAELLKLDKQTLEIDASLAKMLRARMMNTSVNDKWDWRPIGELFDIGAGKTMSAAARNGESPTPFLRTSNVFWDEIDLKQLDSMAISPKELQQKTLKLGDLLVCEGGEIGRAAVWDGQVETMAFQNHLHRLRPIKADVEPRFYVYFLQSAFTQLGIFEGAGNKTTIPNLSRNKLAALDVPKPPLNEQKSIVAALSVVRNALKMHEQSSLTAQELKRTAMRELFTKGLRGEPPKKTDIGLVPESWCVSSIGQHFQVASGGTPSRNVTEFWSGGTIPWVKTTEVSYCSINSTEEHITQSALANSAAKMFPAGTILMAMYGQGVTRGKVAVLGIEAACNQACAAIFQSDGKVDDRYLFQFLTSRYEDIRRLAHGGQQQNLNLEIVRDLALAFPPIEEQREIASILDAIDRKIDLHKRKKAVLEELFKSLLHKLMTGEIRVNDLDLTAIQAGAA